jgi:F-type H+-transporting ATPase subunit delta
LRFPLIAQNYAEALFELAEPAGQLERYGALIEVLGRSVAGSAGIQSVLMSPKVPKALKATILGKALGEIQAPRDFVAFIQAVVRRGRQGLLDEIAEAYGALVDKKLNRVRAAVTVARAPDATLERALAQALSDALGKEVVATFSVDPEILGGAVVRVDDRVYDGSVKRRLTRLRRALLAR